MDIRQLAVFNAVVRHGSLSKAAEEFLLSQPSVSLYVKSLEQEFGCTLLLRNSHGVRPTEAGRQLYEYSLRLLADLDSLHDALTHTGKDRKERPMRLGATKLVASSVMPPIVVALQDRYRDPLIQLVVGESHDLIRKMIEGELDMALVSAGVNLSTLRRVCIEETYAVPLALLSAAAEGEMFWDKAQAVNEISFYDFPRIRYIGPGESSPFGLWLQEELLRRGVARLNPVLITGDMELSKRIIAAGKGVGFIPRLVATEEIAAGSLREIFIKGGALTATLCLISPPTPVRVKYLDALREELGRVLQS